MGAIATGVVEGTISAASYAATETLAYGRDVSFGDVLKVGLTSSIMAGGMKGVMQSIGLCNCFIAGTLVATETGYVTIENIKAGDLVWAHDPETGETALKPVVQTFRNETTEWIHGHTVQLQQLGIVKYALCIGLPSGLEWGSKDYYDKPWEVTADLFGGVQSREASRSDKADAFHYLWLSKQVGPFAWRTID